MTGQAVDWLVALDHGKVDQDAFEAWRRADPRHAAIFAQVAATWRRTGDRRMSELAPAASAAPAPLAEIEPETQPRLTRRGFAAGVGAVAVALGGAAAFVAWPRRAYAETAVGERRTIALPDGSQAMLNTDSRVAWRFDDGRDFWVERGEAALLVRAANAPFRVHSDPIDARLSPGSFNLRLDADGGDLLVRAGRAAAAYRDGGAETITADQRLMVGNGTARIDTITASDMAAATAWQHGDIVFNGMRLDDAIREFNRYLPTKLALGDRSLAATQLGGDFQIAAPEQFLSALHEGFGIGSRREGNRVVLIREGTRANGA